MPEYMYFIFAAILSILGIMGWIAYRNAIYYSKKADDIGDLLIKSKCDIEGDDEEFARICNMTKENFRAEKAKGRAIILAGNEVKGIAEGLKSPFRCW
jgi:hypothetical protein